jgi:SOS-response transcriptional repressor LexA
MDRIVRNGAEIIIDPDDLDLFDKWLYVVRNPDGEVTFKQYRDSPARLVPCSSNPTHATIPLSDRGYEIVGRVVLITFPPSQAALD